MSLRINSDLESRTAYRDVTVAQTRVDTRLAHRPGESVSEPAVSRAHAGDSVSVESRPRTGDLSSALRAAQEDMGLHQAADDSLERVQSILTQLRGLIAQGIDDTRPPAGSDAERQYLALVTELAQLGQATAFNDPPLPTVVDVPAVADRIAQWNGAGLEDRLAADLVDVSAARDSLATHRELVPHALGRLAVALENSAASLPRITDQESAVQQTAAARDQILSHVNAALAAQTETASPGALRLLSS